MREILFRGKRIDNGEWVEGNLFVPDEGHDAPTQICFGTNIVMITYDVDPDTVSEFIGLRDRNGKRIFEGDIITANVGEREYEDEYLSNTNILVSFENGYFYPFAVACGWRSWVDDVEVIGNKWDNPELLKGGAV